EPRRLARLFELDPAGGPCWETEELAAVLAHQLRAPVQFDLATLGDEARRRVQELFAARGGPGLSFGGLLHAPDPSPALLELTMQFAKAHRAHPDSPLPDRVASVLYFGCIIVARMRHRRRISDLGDDELRRGLRWAARQRWVDDKTRALFQQGLRFLSSQKEDGREDVAP